MFSALISKFSETSKEFTEFERLFAPENESLRRLVFFAESPIQYRYYEDYLQYILKASDLEICYLASTIDDPIFESKEKRIKPFFIKNLLSKTFEKLDSNALVIANPDLGKGPFKRAPDSVHHIYAFRGIASVHQAYRLGAFDNYDAMLCVGEYQVAEFRKMEELYKTRKKELVVTGYPLVERVWREHQDYLQSAQANAEPICLLAPSWDPVGRSSILETCIEQVIDKLSGANFKVWIRPHPEFAKRFPKRIEEVAKLAAKTNNISMQLNLASMTCLHQADILLTEHSSISMDYVLGTERPVVFINTPLRVDNPEWQRLGLPAVENVYRQDLGAALELSELDKLAETLNRLLAGDQEFKKRLPALRDVLVANWQKAAQIGGDYIISKARKN